MLKTDSTRQQAAWQVMRWLTSTEPAAHYAAVTMFLPPRRSVLETAAYSQVLKDVPQFQTFVDALNYTFRPYHPDFPAHYGRIRGLMRCSPQGADRGEGRRGGGGARDQRDAGAVQQEVRVGGRDLLPALREDSAGGRLKRRGTACDMLCPYSVNPGRIEVEVAAWYAPSQRYAGARCVTAPLWPPVLQGTGWGIPGPRHPDRWPPRCAGRRATSRGAAVRQEGGARLAPNAARRGARNPSSPTWTGQAARRAAARGSK